MNPPATANASRRMGRLNQTYAYLDLVCNANSCDWLELAGPLDTALLHRAIAATLDRHPMARSVCRRAGVFFEWQHLDRALPFEVEELRLDIEDDALLRRRLLAIVWERRTLAGDRHPLRFLHVRTPLRTVLLIVTCHVYTDGRAASLLSSDIAEAYSRLARGEAPATEVVDLTERSHDRLFLGPLPLLARVGLALSALGSLLHDLLTPAGSVALGATDTRRTDMTVAEIPAALMERLRQRAHDSSLSLHPYFLVAALRAVESFNRSQGREGSRRLRFVDNFSLRRFSTDPVVHKLYDCLAVPYTLQLDGAQCDDTLLRTLSTRLDALKGGQVLRELYRLRFYYWMSLPLPKALATRMACRVFTRADVICTNVGLLDPRVAVFGDVAVKSYYSFPQLFPPGKLMFQLSSYAGALRLLVLFDGGQLDAARVQAELVHPFVEHLGRLADPVAPPELALRPQAA